MNQEPVPELGFEGRVVIVTGSSKGIGRALAAMFAARGASVIVSGRSRGPVGEVAAQLAASGGEVAANVGDVSTEAGADAIVAQALAQYGRIDVVVNNAGILNFSPIAEMSAATFDEMMNVNVRGAFLVTKAAWPHMVQRGYGRVIMFPSQGVYGALNVAHYSASKGALIGLMRGLSLEGRPHGIHVNGVIPYAYTKMFAAASENRKPLVKPGTVDLFAEAPRLLDARLLAPGVGWLCHENCDTSGEIIHAGGGRFARVFIGEVPGYYNPDPSLESVRDNWSQICEETGYIAPGSALDSSMLVLRRNGILSPLAVP